MFYKTLFLFYVRVLLVHGASFRQGISNPETCETKECHDAANHIKKWMNPAFKPCEDFYDFSCGYWHSPDNKTENKQHELSLGSRKNFVAAHVKNFLLDDAINEESKLFLTMKQYLNMCLDEESIEASGVSPAVKFLREAGGWPVLEKHWSEEGWNLLHTEIAVGGVFFNIDIQPREPDSIWTFIVSPKSANGQFIDLSGGFQKDSGKEYFKKICDLAVEFGANRSDAETQMKEALQLEMAIFEISNVSRYLDGLESYNISQLQNEIAWVNWTQLLTAVLPENKTLAPNENVTVIYPNSMRKLGDIINSYSRRTVANCMMSRAALMLSRYLSSIDNNKTGLVTEPRFDTCVEMLKTSSLSGILASYIARKTVSDTRIATQMTQRILDELLLDVNELKWLDEETRSVAIKTLKDTELLISFPEELFNMSTVEELYKTVRINNSNFFEAVMDSRKWMRFEKFRKLGTSLKDMSLQERIEEAMSESAYFRKGANYIVVTAGFLYFLPLFNSKVPAYVNYGHLGGIIAHELTHALDVQTDDPESRVDDNKLSHLMYRWESNDTEEIYNEKKQCIIDQYSSFNDSVPTGIKLNSLQTNTEDVADNGGLKLAFRAYRRLAAQLTVPELKLPGLQQYSNEQLFLISLANAYCEIPEKESLLSQIKYDSHSPFQFRIRGMMMNLPEFSKIFGCKADDPMNPEKKCEVWYLAHK